MFEFIEYFVAASTKSGRKFPQAVFYFKIKLNFNTRMSFYLVY